MPLALAPLAGVGKNVVESSNASLRWETSRMSNKNNDTDAIVRRRCILKPQVSRTRSFSPRGDLAMLGRRSLSPQAASPRATSPGLGPGLGVNGTQVTPRSGRKSQEVEGRPPLPPVTPSASMIAARLEGLLGFKSIADEHDGAKAMHQPNSEQCVAGYQVPAMVKLPGLSDEYGADAINMPRRSSNGSSASNNVASPNASNLPSRRTSLAELSRRPTIEEHSEFGVSSKQTLEPTPPSTDRRSSSSKDPPARRSSRLVLAGDLPSPSNEALASEGGKSSSSRSGSKQQVVIKQFMDHDTFIFSGNGVLWDVEVPSWMENQRSSKELECISMAKVYTMLSLGKRALFVCNSTQHSRRSYVDELKQKGLDICAEEGSEAAQRGAEDSIISIGRTCAWYLRACGSRKPFVFASQRGLLEDLEWATRDLEGLDMLDVDATNDKDGSTFELYNKEPNAKHVREAMDPSADAVVVDMDRDPTTIKLAVAAKHLSSGKKMPLVTCCLPDWKRKLKALWDGSMCRSLTGYTDGITIDLEAQGVSMRWPSREALNALTASRESGGYGVIPDGAAFVSCNLTEVEAVRQSGIPCMLIVNSVVAKTKLRQHREQGRALPDWVVATFADAQ